MRGARRDSNGCGCRATGPVSQASAAFLSATGDDSMVVFIVTGSVGTGAWITVAVEALMAAGFVYVLSTGCRAIRDEVGS